MENEKSIREELSGNVAKHYVSQISRFHRIQASPMFHEAAQYVKNELLKIGLSDATIEQYPSDGATKYWTYTSPVGWTVKSAELRLVEPEEKLICAFEDVPTCLHTFSNATPSEGVTAELVDVGSGTKPKDYEGKDVKGKFVLATGRAKLVHEQAVYKFGAAGVVTDTITFEMPNVRESIDIPDAHAYQGIWPTAHELDRLAFGFSITKRQGNKLRALLREGKTVKLKAKVDTQLSKGNLDVVTATIQGKSKPTEEVFLIAHLCHPKPSANDNASGSGLLLEIARTIKALINNGRIKQPARTIRFIWVPETNGTVAYLSTHPEMHQRFVAGINLDMVGQNQELCKSTLNIDRTPDSLPSYLNDFVFSLIEQMVKEFDPTTAFGSSSTFRYRTNAFSGGSDHAEFAAITLGVPCVMLLQWPDLYYHTSMDTIDHVSEDSLKRVGWVTVVAALTLANATAEEALRLANETATRGSARIAETARLAVEELFRKMHDEKLKGDSTVLANELAKTIVWHKRKFEHVVWREQEAVKSVKRLAETPALNSMIEKYCVDIAHMGEMQVTRLEETLAHIASSAALKITSQLEETGAEKEARKLVPKRLFKGTLGPEALKEAVGEKEYQWYVEMDDKDPEFDKKTAEALNFADGKRSVYHIVQAISAEYTETDPQRIVRFFRDLEKAGLIAFA